MTEAKRGRVSLCDTSTQGLQFHHWAWKATQLVKHTQSLMTPKFEFSHADDVTSLMNDSIMTEAKRGRGSLSDTSTKGLGHRGITEEGIQKKLKVALRHL